LEKKKTLVRADRRLALTVVFRSLLTVLTALAVAEALFANGLGGQRLEKLVGDVIVDVGTDQLSTPVAGKPIEFDFNLLKSDTREPIANTGVGIDIGHNGKSMVNCNLITDPQLTFLIYTFPEPGAYTLKVTFFDTHRDPPNLATASFPLAISGSSDRTRSRYIAIFVLSLLLGLPAGYWAARTRPST
jgi:hypothetical protein